jgi:hypothetical protein
VVPLDQIRVKCLAQGHIDRFFTLSALVFKPATFWLLAQHKPLGYLPLYGKVEAWREREQEEIDRENGDVLFQSWYLVLKTASLFPL